MESSHLKELAIQTFRSFTSALILTALIFIPLAPLSKASTRSYVSESTRTAPEKMYKHLPLAFEPNLGQTDSEVKFISRNDNHVLFLTQQEAVLELAAAHSRKSDELHVTSEVPRLTDPDVLRMKFDGANTSAEMVGLEQLPGTRNYLIGNDQSRWRTDVPTFQKVKYADVYPGVDLIYYANQEGELEYDFVLTSGADPSVISL
jgi:hypothetical protein